MNAIFRKPLLVVWMLGLTACTSTAPEKAALDVQPAPEQAQQSAEAAPPVVEAEQANKAKAEEAAAVAEKTAAETKKPPKVVEKAAVETKKTADAAAGQKNSDKQKIASAPAPANKNREIRARHILVATREEAEKIIVRLQSGEDFGAIARELSTDPTAKQNSGELGFFRRGMMVPEFEQAAYALPVGQVSRVPVKTQFGWHVIHVEEERALPASSG
jgi:peptidyl-prolyl cis-trans isomerase C